MSAASSTASLLADAFWRDLSHRLAALQTRDATQATTLAAAVLRVPPAPFASPADALAHLTPFHALLGRDAAAASAASLSASFSASSSTSAASSSTSAASSSTSAASSSTSAASSSTSSGPPWDAAALDARLGAAEARLAAHIESAGFEWAFHMAGPGRDARLQKPKSVQVEEERAEKKKTKQKKKKKNQKMRAHSLMFQKTPTTTKKKKQTHRQREAKPARILKTKLFGYHTSADAFIGDSSVVRRVRTAVQTMVDSCVVFVVLIFFFFFFFFFFFCLEFLIY
jgi:hypothetical protein